MGKYDAAYYRGQAIAHIDPLVAEFRKLAELAESENNEDKAEIWDEAADILEAAISAVEDEK